MPSFIPGGTPQTGHITFNSGYFDFGNSRLIDVENITVTYAWTLADLFVLNSIKPQYKARHSQKVSLTGQIKSMSPSLEMLIMGSSTIGNPNSAATLDGQASQGNPVITMFDTNNNEYQYQLAGAVFKSMKMSAKMEDYSMWDFELEALDIVAVQSIL